VCTLDGKELAVLLYEKYADLDQRTFPNEEFAKFLGARHFFECL